MNKKYVFLDIDGTLVINDAISDSTLRALQQAQKNGHEIVLCTGRSMCQIFPFLLEKFPFDGIVSSSGANIQRHGKAVVRHVFPKSITKPLFEFFEARGSHYTIHTHDRLYNSLPDRERMLAWYVSDGQTIEEAFPGRVFLEHPEELPDIEMVAFMDEALEEVTRCFSDVCHISPGELTMKGIHKGSGIREYIEHCGGSMADTVAIGDSSNDVGMLSSAAYGVAMGNAEELLKPLADFVTDDIEKDGIQKAFFRLGLI